MLLVAKNLQIKKTSFLLHMWSTDFWQVCDKPARLDWEPTLTQFTVKKDHNWVSLKYCALNSYLAINTTLDKSCWDNSWKSSKFKKWLNFSNSKFPSYHLNPLPPRPPPISTLNHAKTLRTTLIWAERGFFSWKIDFLFCLKSFIYDCMLIHEEKLGGCNHEITEIMQLA